RHPDVGDQTPRLVLLARLQEGLGGAERCHREARRSQQTLHGASIRAVVLDHGDESFLPLSTHGGKDRSARRKPQLWILIGSPMCSYKALMVTGASSRRPPPGSGVRRRLEVFRHSS